MDKIFGMTLIRKNGIVPLLKEWSDRIQIKATAGYHTKKITTNIILFKTSYGVFERKNAPKIIATATYNPPPAPLCY